ncbi:LPS export ABC transporter periplasmic protein LptC [Novosphingobium sp.]|uniref:LPS export ABC transporter periplasmic protein LptC n=1 Tax=Novosphingobium sp. TaxID=1874826 RepID=UPI0031CF2B8D
MTLSKRQIHDKRRAMALPGCQRELLLGTLGRFLPGAAGVVVAVMVVWPLFPHNSVSFLLDRNKVQVTENRMLIQSAAYRGKDTEGRPFELSARDAVQHSAQDPLVRMNQLIGTIALNDGPARLEAAQGNFDIAREQLTVPGQLRFQHAGGYDMHANQVVIDVRHQTVLSKGSASGLIPSGDFSGDHMYADLDKHTVRLEGRARLRMTPGKTMQNAQADLKPAGAPPPNQGH